MVMEISTAVACVWGTGEETWTKGYEGPFRDKGNAPCLVLSGIYTATYICPKPLN